MFVAWKGRLFFVVVARVCGIVGRATLGAPPGHLGGGGRYHIIIVCALHVLRGGLLEQLYVIQQPTRPALGAFERRGIWHMVCTERWSRMGGPRDGSTNHVADFC